MTHTAHTKPAAAHTPEPWHYEVDYSVTTIFAPDPTGQNPYGTYVAEIDGQDVGRFATREQHEANARRICAAVNACRGIPTRALEQGVVGGLREALGRLLDQIDTLKGESSCIDEDILKGEPYAAARAVIARAASG
jgi:hypothetical protein